MCFRCTASTSFGLELRKRSAAAHSDICQHNDGTAALYSSGAPGQGCMPYACECVFADVYSQLYTALTPVSVCAHLCRPHYSSKCYQMLLLSHLLNVLASYASHLPNMVSTTYIILLCVLQLQAFSACVCVVLFSNPSFSTLSPWWMCCSCLRAGSVPLDASPKWWNLECY